MESLKGRLYAALQDNEQQRKQCEIELSKQKAKTQDLKIKIASLNMEHKEYIGSLASKVEMTSQTLIREVDQKEKVKNFTDAERKKFFKLVESKEKEINDLLLTIKTIKGMHEE